MNLSPADIAFYTEAVLRACRVRIGADFLNVVYDVERAFGLPETALDVVADALCHDRVEIAADGCAVKVVR